MDSKQTPPAKFTQPREFPGAIHYDEEEIQAVTDVLRRQSPFRYYGPDCRMEVAQFEKELAQYLRNVTGIPGSENTPLYVTAVNSGTGALEVALDSLGVGCGDEVCVQGFMWISSISAIVRNRAIPVLVDSDGTLNMDPKDLRRKITPRTKVVMPVPMLGGCARIGEIMALVREVNRDRIAQNLPPVRVLEDCAQSLGAHATGIPGSIEPQAPVGTYRIGTFGDVGIFSLQINKNISAGEGGMIVTRDPVLAQRIEALHNAGYAKEGSTWQNWYGDIPMGWGHGRRMTEMQGAIARVQLRKLDKILSNMRRSHARIAAHLRSLGIQMRDQADSEPPGDTGYYCCFVLPKVAGDEIAQIQLGRQIVADLNEYGLHPWLMHDFEVHVYYNVTPLVKKTPINGGCPWQCSANTFHSQYNYARGALPVLDDLFLRTVGINLPSQLTPEHEAQICDVLTYVVLKHLPEKVQ